MQECKLLKKHLLWLQCNRQIWWDRSLLTLGLEKMSTKLFGDFGQNKIQSQVSHSVFFSRLSVKIESLWHTPFSFSSFSYLFWMSKSFMVISLLKAHYLGTCINSPYKVSGPTLITFFGRDFHDLLSHSRSTATNVMLFAAILVTKNIKIIVRTKYFS